MKIQHLTSISQSPQNQLILKMESQKLSAEIQKKQLTFVSKHACQMKCSISYTHNQTFTVSLWYLLQVCTQFLTCSCAPILSSIK